MNNSPQRAAKGFTRAFWVSNTVELFERMAYYAVFIVLTIYLSSILGFNDFEASMISGLFSGGLYLLLIIHWIFRIGSISYFAGSCRPG